MCRLVVEVRREIDDLHGLEGAFLDADTASDAEFLGNLRDLGRGRDLDAEFSGDLARGAGAHAHDGAGSLALLSALLGLAFIRGDDGDSRHLVRLLLFLSLGLRHFSSEVWRMRGDGFFR